MTSDPHHGDSKENTRGHIAGEDDLPRNDAAILYAELVSNNSQAPQGVPQRFGLFALLALMAVFSMVFGLLRFGNTPALVYLFLGGMAFVSGIAQMRFGDVPRMASIVAGAIFLPLFSLGTRFFTEMMHPEQSRNLYEAWPPFAVPCMIFGGAISGYLIGAVVAGVFLLANLWEQRVAQRTRPIAPPASPFHD